MPVGQIGNDKVHVVIVFVYDFEQHREPKLSAITVAGELSMGISENKQVVTEFFSHSSAGRRAQALDLLGEDATWWAPGVGVMSKPQFVQMMGYMDKIVKGPIQLTIKRMTAEEDRVAAEAESDADVVNGKHYHNTYHFLVVVRGGKIREVKEYNDTKYAMDLFGDLIPGNR